MSQVHSPRVQSLMATERALLRRICQSGGIRTVASEAQQTLHRYGWVCQDHQTIFQALVRLAYAPANTLREQLPAEATRLGFPDIQWDAYFEARPGEGEAEDTVAELIGKLISPSAPLQ